MEKKGEKLDLEKEERTPDELIIREGNISMILDSYDDIFSDFDPRPYEQKALSDDFLVECKKAAEDKKTEVELRMLIPQTKRNPEAESKIKKRLRNHFQSHYKQKQEEKDKKKRNRVGVHRSGTNIRGNAAVHTNPQGFPIHLIIHALRASGMVYHMERA